MNETVGINKIIGDLKTLGFKKKPHHQSCRQKSYDLSKTANFYSTYNGGSQLNFFTSFDNGYNKHKGPSFIRNEGLGNQALRQKQQSSL